LIKKISSRQWIKIALDIQYVLEKLDAKFKEGVFLGPQIRELKQDVKYETS